MIRKNAWNVLKTKPVRDHQDIQLHFDAAAPDYAEQHGNPSRLLRYRLALIRRYACFQPEATVLEVGCGNGMHLRMLADSFAHGIGIDLSPAMLDVARQQDSPWARKLDFRIDKGEQLHSVSNASIDVAFCVGALEHMLDKAAVIRSVFRVLKPGGRFVCLTPNGDYIWYRFLAPLGKLDTTHLSTDRFLSSQELQQLFREAGFDIMDKGYWTFIPRGDMHPCLAGLLQGLDWIGRLTRLATLRGGVVVSGYKPE